MKKNIIALFVGIIVLLFVYFSKEGKSVVNREALEDLNLQLTGVVRRTDDPGNFNGTGIAGLKIISSNIENYDPRGKQEYYYCIIKNGEAEIYDSHVNFMSLGDTVVIDTKNRVIKYKSNNKEVEGNIFVNTSERFYDYIKKHHQKL